MIKRSEGNKKMPTLIKNDLNKRIFKNTAQYNESIRRVRSNIRSKNLNRGRMRPRDPDEAEVLSRFERKSNYEY
ncbi:hypothetical protein GCM10008983_19010 [Lentibacillus halophilus]|uniref:Uncharacterized protein n=1 Tax=Lentibacillus halophilus TaxID=295065 RepID=A0ABN0ZBN5_9BACI